MYQTGAYHTRENEEKFENRCSR